jgi:hypothetical protein
MINQMFHDDLEAFTDAIEKEELELANIFANRYASDAYLLKSDSHSILGALLKELILNLLEYKSRNQFSQDNIASAMQPVLEIDIDGMKEIDDIIPVFKKFFIYFKDHQALSITDIEQEAYIENDEISILYLDILLDYLRDRKDIVGQQWNIVSKGILNELNRIVKLYGFNTKVFLGWINLRMFDRVIDYQYFISQFDIPEDHQKYRDISCEDLCNKIILVKEFEEDRKDQLVTQLTILSELTMLWRNYFLLYMDIPKPGPSIQRREIRLPDDARKKIGDILTKALEKEVDQK